jgi:hypothetical protein
MSDKNTEGERTACEVCFSGIRFCQQIRQSIFQKDNRKSYWSIIAPIFVERAVALPRLKASSFSAISILLEALKWISITQHFE